MASKKMKYASVFGIGLMTMSLVACANEGEQYQTIGDSGLKTPQNTTVATTGSEKACREYELQKDGSYKCDDNNVVGGGGGGGGFFFFNGNTYGSQSAMVASNDYKKNNLVSGTKYTKSSTDGRKNSSSSKSSSKSGSSGSSGKSSTGFGSGGRGSSGGS